MLIQGSGQDWQEWTEIDFTKSGKYQIDGALDLVELDVEKDKGMYIEPNVWMIHEV